MKTNKLLFSNKRIDGVCYVLRLMFITLSLTFLLSNTVFSQTEWYEKFLEGFSVEISSPLIPQAAINISSNRFKVASILDIKRDNPFGKEFAFGMTKSFVGKPEGTDTLYGFEVKVDRISENYEGDVAVLSGESSNITYSNGAVSYQFSMVSPAVALTMKAFDQVTDTESWMYETYVKILLGIGYYTLDYNISLQQEYYNTTKIHRFSNSTSGFTYLMAFRMIALDNLFWDWRLSSLTDTQSDYIFKMQFLQSSIGYQYNF